MKIISSIPTENGAYPPIQTISGSMIPDGMAEWPDKLSTETFYRYNGFVTLTIDDGIVTECVPNIDAWDAWKALLSNDELVTSLDPVIKLRADLDYLSIMTGVAL